MKNLEIKNRRRNGTFLPRINGVSAWAVAQFRHNDCCGFVFNVSLIHASFTLKCPWPNVDSHRSQLLSGLRGGGGGQVSGEKNEF